MTLTKADLAQKIAADCGFVKGGGGRDRDRLFDVIKAGLVSSEDVMVSAFGKWGVKSKWRRRGRNAKIGEEIILAMERELS